MNVKNFSAAFSALNVDERKYFLSLLAHNITVALRDTYPSESEEIEISTIIALNEAQHRVTNQLMHKLKNKDGYSPADFFEIILNDDRGRPLLIQAIEWSFKAFEKK
jgi:hypothetical protein